MKYSCADNLLDKVHDLTQACLSGNISPEDAEYFDELLSGNDTARHIYVNVVHDSLNLRKWAATERNHIRGLFEGVEVEYASQYRSYNASGILHNVFNSTIGYFSNEMPLSMLIATVVMASVLCFAWLFNINHYQEFAGRTLTPSGKHLDPDILYIGRITGMKDCQWAKPNTQTVLGASVPLEREYALSSGLMEITYISGAKVVLEGPCTFKVDSNAGGCLVLGKLTARVETKDSEFKVQDSGSDTAPSSFVVKTPTAIVTDLGTEFGIKVNKNGETTAHVLEGQVEFKPLDVNRPDSIPIRLVAGESAQMVKKSNGTSAYVIRGKADVTAFSAWPGIFANQESLKPFRLWQRFSKELCERSDLLAYYDFQPVPNDKSVLRNLAATGKRFDGLVENAAWVSSNRIPGKQALRFNSSSKGVHINIPIECERLTLAAWIKLDYFPTPSQGFAGLLMSDGWNVDNSVTGRVAWQIRHDGRLNFCLDNWNDALHFPLPVEGFRLRDRWHHFAVTYAFGHDASSVDFFFDGQHEGAGKMIANVDPGISAKIGAATIGAWDSQGIEEEASSRRIHGDIGELMIFSDALSVDEVRQLYDRGTAENTIIISKLQSSPEHTENRQ